jgi:hypothetical protein
MRNQCMFENQISDLFMYFYGFGDKQTARDIYAFSDVHFCTVLIWGWDIWTPYIRESIGNAI